MWRWWRKFSSLISVVAKKFTTVFFTIYLIIVHKYITTKQRDLLSTKNICAAYYCYCLKGKMSFIWKGTIFLGALSHHGFLHIQGIHKILCFFLKCCDFSDLCQFCCSAGCSTCLVSVYTLTPRENRVWTILNSSKKTQYL